MAEMVAKKLVPFVPEDPLARREEVAAEAVLGVFETGERRPALVRKILFRRAIDYLRRINHFKLPQTSKLAKPKVERTGYVPTRVSSGDDCVSAEDASEVIEAHLPTDMHVRIFRMMRNGESIIEIGRITSLNPSGLWAHVRKIREIGKIILADKPAFILGYRTISRIRRGIDSEHRND